MTAPRPKLSMDDLFSYLTKMQVTLRKHQINANSKELMIAYSRDTSSQTSTTSTDLKDTGVGDISFDVSDTNAVYRITYRARGFSSATNTLAQFSIRDGGASSPTNSSTIIAADTVFIPIAGGPGATTGGVEDLITGLAVGTHTIAAFYHAASGAGSVNPSNATGGGRFLSVELVG